MTPSKSGFRRVTEYAKENGNDVPHEALEMPEIEITEAGYVYIYLSNENGTPVDVYFDDFNVTHSQTNIVQYNEYYPFGLQTANSWTREEVVSNSFLYNGGSELNSASGNYEMFFREYDPAIGRMNAVDPMASKYASLTPYNYSFNSPVVFNDPSGAEPPGGYGISDDPRVAPTYNYETRRWEGGSINRDDGFNDWAIRTGNFHLLREGSYQNNGDRSFTRSEIINAYWVDYDEVNESGTIEGGDFTVHGVRSTLVVQTPGTIDQVWYLAFASSALAFIATDVAVIEPTDALWAKWVGYGATTAIAGALLSYEDIEPGYGDPNLWVAHKGRAKTISEWEPEENHFPENNGKTNAIAFFLARVAAGAVLIGEYGVDLGVGLGNKIRDGVDKSKSFFNDVKNKSIQGIYDMHSGFKKGWPY